MRVLKEDLRKPQGSPKDAPMDYFNYEGQIAPTTLSFKRASGAPVKVNRFQGKFFRWKNSEPNKLGLFLIFR